MSMWENFEQWVNPSPLSQKYNYIRAHRPETDSYITLYYPNITGYSADEIMRTLYPGWDLINLSIDCPDWA